MSESLVDKAIRQAAGRRGMTSNAAPQNAESERWFRGLCDRATGRARAGESEGPKPEKPKPAGDGGGGSRGTDLPATVDANLLFRRALARYPGQGEY